MKEKLMKNRMVREEEKQNRYWRQFGRKCPNCDCMNYLKPSVDMVRCKICGTKIYQNDQIKFKYELAKRLLDANK